MASIIDYVQEYQDNRLNNLLGVESTPNPLFTEEELGECYQGLAAYLSEVYDGSRLHKRHAAKSWSILEFQSSWHVLWKFYRTEQINTLLPQHRHQEYEKRLEGNRDLFPNLSAQRSRTKKRLEELITSQPKHRSC